MNTSQDRPALHALRADLAGFGTLAIHPLDIEDACRRYEADGYEVTPRLREFLATFGECTVTWQFRANTTHVTTSVRQTLESAYALPRNLRIHAKRLGRPVTLIGTTGSLQESVLLADNDDILLYADGGFQRVAHGFANAVRAMVTGDWDKTLFDSVP
jgi:hypothetical protein